jgi:hypothetical protein
MENGEQFHPVWEWATVITSLEVQGRRRRIFSVLRSSDTKELLPWAKVFVMGGWVGRIRVWRRTMGGLESCALLDLIMRFSGDNILFSVLFYWSEVAVENDRVTGWVWRTHLLTILSGPREFLWEEGRDCASLEIDPTVWSQLICGWLVITTSVSLLHSSSCGKRWLQEAMLAFPFQFSFAVIVELGKSALLNVQLLGTCRQLHDASRDCAICLGPVLLYHFQVSSRLNLIPCICIISLFYIFVSSMSWRCRWWEKWL